MIEIVAGAARWVQLVANLTLLGSFTFLSIVGVNRQTYLKSWIDKLVRVFPWLAVSILLALLVILFTMLAQIVNDVSSLASPQKWFDFIQNTQVGQVWALRFFSAVLLLLMVVYACYKKTSQSRFIACALISTFPLITSSLASHTATDNPSFMAILPYALHLVLAGIWFGALPTLLLLMNHYEKRSTGKEAVINLLSKFSVMALPVMILIIVTGLIAGDRIFDNQFAALVATPYGWLFCIKFVLLGLILLIAYRVRNFWLPLIIGEEKKKEVLSISAGLYKWVRIEYALALLLILVATVITHTTPVKHATIENWPFSFRFSIIATWNEPNVALQVWVGGAIVLLALGMVKLGSMYKWGSVKLIGIFSVLFISGIAVALPPLAIQAYPETYRKPLVPFDAISVSNGMKLYTEHCVECHGAQGKGNGIKSRTLSTKLPDMLVEPHIVEHTPGDFYNWITYGMPDTDMPGYEDKIPEEGRWDLINFIHALSRGYQGRILTPEVTVNRASSAVPPGFAYTTYDGTTGLLQDFRQQQAVLLIMFSWPESQERMAQLKEMSSIFEEHKLTLLVVPSGELNSEALQQIAQELPFAVIADGADEILQSYALWRRTMTYPDILGRGTIPNHMEFLIDKNGYLRARWIPDFDSTGWSDLGFLVKQVELLNSESIKLAYPEEFVR